MTLTPISSIALAALGAVADSVRNNALRPAHEAALDRARALASTPHIRLVAAAAILRKSKAPWSPVLRLVVPPTLDLAPT